MTDYFAVLGVPRAPWLDPEELKARFHRLSAQHHPDATGGSAQAFTELNAAWQTLREPAKALRHFLELEHPSTLTASSQPPPELSDLFMDIAGFRQASQRLAARLAATSTPLARALIEPERVALRAKAETLAKTVAEHSDKLVFSVRQGVLAPQQLASAHASFVFLEKWSALLAEAQLELSKTAAH